MKKSKKIFGLLWVTAGLCFLLWVYNSYRATGFGNEILESSKAVVVKSANDYISFTPVKPYQKVFIFYPGALVAPQAYAPLCRAIANAGCKSIIIKMPWRLASYGYKKPIEMGLFNDDTKQYILAGHSKGAMMAAQFVYENPSLIDKLILIGTTHPKEFDLSASKIPIMKIYGSKDGVAKLTEINANKTKLPPATKYVLINGANHSQFGYYGSQLGDNKATVTREVQQSITTNAVLLFMNSK